MSEAPNPIAIVVAGGTGTRMGADLPKQFLPLAGEPVLVHTVRRMLEALPHPAPIVCVLHPEWTRHWDAMAREYFRPAQVARLHTVSGGKQRTDSVYYGLLRVEDLVADLFNSTVVVVHDGVRPFFTNDMLNAALRSAAHHTSGVCCVPVKSSIRMRTATGSQAVNRDLFFHVQTPQCFRLPQLLASYEEADPDVEYTDDASLFEAAGHAVHMVPGSYDNLKLTTPEDLLVAEAYFSEQRLVNNQQ